MGDEKNSKKTLECILQNWVPLKKLTATRLLLSPTHGTEYYVMHRENFEDLEDVSIGRPSCGTNMKAINVLSIPDISMNHSALLSDIQILQDIDKGWRDTDSEYCNLFEPYACPESRLPCPVISKASYWFLTVNDLLSASEELNWRLPERLIANIADGLAKDPHIVHGRMKISGLSISAKNVVLDYSDFTTKDCQGHHEQPDMKRRPTIKLVNFTTTHTFKLPSAEQFEAENDHRSRANKNPDRAQYLDLIHTLSLQCASHDADEQVGKQGELDIWKNIKLRLPTWMKASTIDKPTLEEIFQLEEGQDFDPDGGYEMSFETLSEIKDRVNGIMLKKRDIITSLNWRAVVAQFREPIKILELKFPSD